MVILEVPVPGFLRRHINGGKGAERTEFVGSGREGRSSTVRGLVESEVVAICLTTFWPATSSLLGRLLRGRRGERGGGVLGTAHAVAIVKLVSRLCNAGTERYVMSGFRRFRVRFTMVTPATIYTCAKLPWLIEHPADTTIPIALQGSFVSANTLNSAAHTPRSRRTSISCLCTPGKV